ncbi:gamma-glutamyltranspeptidase [Syncephalis plumigaleata]|nr:gamma-glutamyltranspeptidase [Syncephalis plumigaleata]
MQGYSYEQQPLLGTNQQLKPLFQTESRLTRLRRQALTIVLATTAILCILLNIVSFDNSAESASWPDAEVIKAKQGAVASEHETCSQIGVDILKKGGSAVDAAISSTLCIGVINSFSSGIGGGGFMLVRNSDGTAVTIDFREAAPGQATELMFKNKQGASTSGGLAVAVPGELRGFEEAHRRYGKLKWNELLEPVIKLSRDGFPVTSLLETRLRSFTRTMVATPGFREVFTRNGKTLRRGDICQRKALAETLEKVAKDGADVFYKGSIADELVKAVRATGAYSPKKIWPAIGGCGTGTRRNLSWSTYTYTECTYIRPVLLNVLNVLEQYNMTSPSALDFHRIVEAFKHGFAQRTKLGDPKFVDIKDEIQRIINKDTAKQIRDRIVDDRTFPPDYYHPQLAGNDPHGTTHTTTIDKDGQTVSVMSTVNLYFGARVVSPTTGVILNNEMDDFSTPGMPNAFGLPPAVNNFIRPGKRPLSSSVPVIVEENGQVVFAAGASGGSRILTSVIGTLVDVLDYKMPIEAAINRPRFHHQLIPNQITVEARFNKDIAKELSSRGHAIGWSPVEVSQSSVQAIFCPYNPAQQLREIHAVSDGRKHGKAAGY